MHKALEAIAVAALTIAYYANVSPRPSQPDVETLTTSGTHESKSSGSPAGQDKLPDVRGTEYPPDGVMLGNGWNSIRERKTPASCLVFGESKSSGQDTYSELIDVIDDAAMMRELNVSASAGFKNAAVDVSTKVKFARNIDIKDNTNYFVGHAYVMNPVRFIVPPGTVVSANDAEGNTTTTLALRPGKLFISGTDSDGSQIRLKPHYLDVAKTNPLEFIQTCGDSFVSAIHEGAELVAFLNISTHEVKTKETMAGEINGSFDGATLNPKADTALDTYQKNGQLKILYYKSGGNGDPVPIDKKGLLDAICGLAKSAKEAAKPFSITLQRYDSLPDWPTSGPPAQLSSLELVAIQYNKLRTLFDQIETIKGSATEFILDHGITTADLGSTQDEIKMRMGSLAKSADKCFQGEVEGCRVETRDSLSDYQYRIRLPAASGSFTEDLQITALGASIAGYQNKLKALDDQWNSLNGVPNLQKLFRDSYTRQVKENTDALNIAKASLQSLRLQYPSALREAIYEQWVRYPNTIRCREAPESSECLDNNQLKVLKEKITTN